MKTGRIIRISLALGIFWFLIHTIYMMVDGLRDPVKKADIAVILGNKVNTDGSPSERLKARLDKGLELYRSKRVPCILVSGGLGKEGHWEAEVMRDYLLLKGVPDSCVITDNRGNDTEMTVVNSLALRDSLEFNSIIVVSQYFHVTRTKKLYREHGFTNLQSAAPDYFEWRDLYSIPREFVAYYLD